MEELKVYGKKTDFDFGNTPRSRGAGFEQDTRTAQDEDRDIDVQDIEDYVNAENDEQREKALKAMKDPRVQAAVKTTAALTIPGVAQAVAAKQLTDAIVAKRNARIDQGLPVVGRGRILGGFKSMFTREEKEKPKRFGPRREQEAMGGMMYNKGSLVGNQSLLDKNNDGKISGEDFKMLREKKIFGSLVRGGTKLAKKGLDSLLVTADDIRIKNSKEYKQMVKELTTDDAKGAGVVYSKAEIKELEKDIPPDAAAEMFNELLMFKKRQDDFANELINSGVKPSSVKKILSRDFKDEDLTKGELSIRNKFMEKYFPRDSETNRLLPEKRTPILIEFESGKEPKAMGGRIDYQEGSLMVPPEMESDMPVDTYPNIPPEEMAAAEASQLPDAEMEDKYMDFVLDQSLDDDEQSYLMNALEDDPKLSQIFDKVITTASEFTGAGEVEGPGTGVSDSIPARLSDGEFVFTKKATDQIGADNLQMMMDDAERAFDGGMMREPKRMGGMMMEDEDPDLMEAMSNEDINRQMLMSNRAPSLLGTN